MPLTNLTAKANTGAGTDILATVTTANGLAGAVALVDDTGNLITTANPITVGLTAAQITALQPLATQPVSGTLGANLTQIAGSTIITTGVAGQEKVGISDSLGGSIFGTPYGRATVELNPHQIFYDPFDGALDTTDRWTTPTVGNSAVAATTAIGAMTLGTGTTASGWSKLSSQSAFTPTVPGWIGFSFLNLLPDLAAPIANSYRFWGSGNIATTPTVAAPMTDAVGFEVDITGKMFAVIYTAGVRTAVQDLSAATGNSKQPTDALLHRYIVKVRTDRVYFYIDGESSGQLVATFSATTATSGPSIQTLPISFLAVGAATPPVSNAQLSSLGAVVWDAAQNNNTLSDGSFQWRKATVKKASTAAVASDTALVVAISPNNTVPVSIASNTPSTTLDTTATGTLTALNSTVVLITNGVGTSIFELTNTWVGTVTFEGSNNNFLTSQAIAAVFLGGIQTQSANATANGYYSVITAGFAKVQARMSAYTSGTATVLANGSSADRIIVPIQGNADNNLTKSSAAVTTAAPNYTTGTTNPLSMTTAGALRVDASASGAATDVTLQLNNTKTDSSNTILQGISEKTLPNVFDIGPDSDFNNIDVSAALLDANGDLSLNVNLKNNSLPLPTLAATSTKQSDGSQKTQIVDGAGLVIASGSGLSTNAMRVATATDATIRTGLDPAGVSRFLSTDQVGTLLLRNAQSTTTELSQTELLTNIMAASRATVHLLTQLVALARGQSDPAAGEEADSIIGEYSTNIFNNLPN